MRIVQLEISLPNNFEECSVDEYLFSYGKALSTEFSLFCLDA